ncbi:hypothetical protein NQ318_023629 [Aromia moschata]|uniref:Helitron helicase n=1 Tax=Aromia moschata TaxID=1265417 RepID=A0AAV8YS52_9CUCU|nr:hypothetical protein NQ318_023629 [Aromia moschata]
MEELGDSYEESTQRSREYYQDTIGKRYQQVLRTATSFPLQFTKSQRTTLGIEARIPDHTERQHPRRGAESRGSHGDIISQGKIYLTPEEAIDQRVQNNRNLDGNLIRPIEVLLRDVNPFARAYRHLKEVYDEEMARIEELRRNNAVHAPLQMPVVALELPTVRGRENRPYALPATNEVAAVYRLDPDTPPTPNIRVYTTQGPDRFQTLRYTDETIQPLTFPLLFPHGETGWHINIPHANNQRRRVTQSEYYSHRLAIRERDK